MNNRLKNYFPMIRTREEVQNEIGRNAALDSLFKKWGKEHQEEFLDMCTGASSACYSADLLLRQYKRARGEKKKKFSYRDIKKVYTIVLFENSAKEFHQFPDDYLHYFKMQSNTGLELDLLQDYLFIPLDIFQKNLQNKGINSKLEAWLVFLCMDEPEMIVKLIGKYPEFRKYYEEIYETCRNLEGVMYMFSEELRELDRNTVQYMIDDMQNQVDGLKAVLEKEREKAEKERKIAEKERKIAEEERQKRIAVEKELKATRRENEELKKK